MPKHTCPTCRKRFAFKRMEDHATYPFCSERCRLADLGAWFEARYVIAPVEEETSETRGPADQDAAPS